MSRFSVAPPSDIKTTKQKQKEARDSIIIADIEKINDAVSNENISLDELKALHIQIDGKYGACIHNWTDSTYAYNPNFGYDYEVLEEDDFKQNLSLFKARLEGFLHGFAIPLVSQNGPANVVNVNNTNTNSINIEISFDDARKQVEDMTSLTNEQTQEILDKISEIESICNDGETKKSKWERIKPVLTWLTDKSFDVAMVLLPLLLKIGG